MTLNMKPITLWMRPITQFMGQSNHEAYCSLANDRGQLLMHEDSYLQHEVYYLMHADK